MANLNEALFHAGVQHQIYLQRYATQTVRDMLELLNQSEIEITNALISADLTEFSQKRLRAMLAEIRAISSDAYQVLQKRLSGTLIDTARYEADFNANLIESLAPVEITLVRPSLDTLSALLTSKPMQGRFIADELKELDAGRIKQIEQALRMGIIEGETNADIMRRIRGTKAQQYKDGILQRSRDDVERLVRTSITHITARARDELYQENQSVVKAWRFTATLDRRTTVICASLDGQVFDLGSGPMPPRHYNCRSSSTPILRSWEELGISAKEASPSTRASMDGQVPDSLTYQEWLKKQSAEVQDDVLGKTKGQLFRDGGLTLDRFVDFKGDIYTLAQLKAREADAFAKLQR
jgi:SPP1 gp7 family putative phage head morphogenesis protein